MTRPRKRRDQIENMIESALQPGRFVGWNEGSSFVSDLSSVEAETAKVTASEPARAVALYETFLAGCYAKADEVDDSDGAFGTFAGDLYQGWIAARQAADADPGETVRLLLKVEGRRLLRFPQRPGTYGCESPRSGAQPLGEPDRKLRHRPGQRPRIGFVAAEINDLARSSPGIQNFSRT